MTSCSKIEKDSGFVRRRTLQASDIIGEKLRSRFLSLDNDIPEPFVDLLEKLMTKESGTISIARRTVRD